MKNNLSGQQIFIFFFEKKKKKKCIFAQKSQFSECSPKHDSNPQMYRCTEKKCLCEKHILKTRGKVSVHPLGPSTHVFAMANFKGYHTLMHVLKTREGKDNETFRQHL